MGVSKAVQTGRLGVAGSPAFRAVGFDQSEQVATVKDLYRVSGLGDTALEREGSF